MKENADKARALDSLELQKHLRESEDQIYRLALQIRMGQSDGLKKYRALRKERARMLTVAGERARDARTNPAPAQPEKVAKKKR